VVQVPLLLLSLPYLHDDLAHGCRDGSWRLLRNTASAQGFIKWDLHVLISKLDREVVLNSLSAGLMQGLKRIYERS
jgi:hypothetical protein